MCHGGIWGSGGKAPPLLLSALDRGEYSASGAQSKQAFYMVCRGSIMCSGIYSRTVVSLVANSVMGLGNQRVS
jgi:hypothetical protein